MSGGLFGDPGPVRARCSRARCSADATAALHWSNPRIHTDGREKIWLACEEHEPVLLAFLADRGFPVRVVPFSEAEPTAEVAG